MGFKMRGVTRIVVRSSDMINAVKFTPTRTSSMVKEEEKEEHLREFGKALLVDFDPEKKEGSGFRALGLREGRLVGNRVGWFLRLRDS